MKVRYTVKSVKLRLSAERPVNLRKSDVLCSADFWTVMCWFAKSLIRICEICAGDAPGCMSSITVATYAMLDSADSEETGARCAVTEKSAGAMRDDKSILIETHLAVQDITSFFINGEQSVQYLEVFIYVYVR